MDAAPEDTGNEPATEQINTARSAPAAVEHAAPEATGLTEPSKRLNGAVERSAYFAESGIDKE